MPSRLLRGERIYGASAKRIEPYLNHIVQEVGEEMRAYEPSRPGQKNIFHFGGGSSGRNFVINHLVWWNSEDDLSRVQCVWHWLDRCAPLRVGWPFFWVMVGHRGAPH